MRQSIVVLAMLGGLLSTEPAAAQMLNDPPRQNAADRQDHAAPAKAVRLTEKPDRVGGNGAVEIEAPTAAPAQLEGSPGGLPLGTPLPYGGGTSEQQMGLYRALTK